MSRDLCVRAGDPVRRIVVDLDTDENDFETWVVYVVLRGHLRERVFLLVIVRLEVNRYESHRVPQSSRAVQLALQPLRCSGVEPSRPALCFGRRAAKALCPLAADRRTRKRS